MFIFLFKPSLDVFVVMVGGPQILLSKNTLILEVVNCMNKIGAIVCGT